MDLCEQPLNKQQKVGYLKNMFFFFFRGGGGGCRVDKWLTLAFVLLDWSS